MIKRFVVCCSLILIADMNPVLNAAIGADSYDTYELAGGESTYAGPINSNVYSHPSTNLPILSVMDFNLGNALFRRVWAPGLTSSRSSDGLGPLFNSRSCQRCHIKDGRGNPPLTSQQNPVSMVIALGDSQSEADSSGNYEGVSKRFGKQIQPFAVPGLIGEGDVKISYSEIDFTYPDGTKRTLLKPEYEIIVKDTKPVPKSAVLSPRVAPPMIGLGLLEAIPEKSILTNSDKNDANQDGISGRANYGFSLLHQKTMLGRFGWKASAPTIADQSAAAFATDMGLSSPLINTDFGDCTKYQNECNEHALATDDAKERFEVSQDIFNLVVMYSSNLAVPRSRVSDQKEFIRGTKLFEKSDCSLCHVSSFVTGNSERIANHLRGQKIWPYSDLLLHDMGPELADISGSGFARSSEWRTAPLWGIGLAKTVNPNAKYLHDGRARSIEEAILWHNGEALKSKNKFISLSKIERARLLNFLSNL